MRQVVDARRFALVTGATRGLGRRTALALAEAGLDVAITGRTVHEGDGRVAARVAGDGDDVEVPGSLDTTAREIEERGQRCLPLVMDLRSAESVRATAAEVLDTWSAPAVLVNNGIVHEPQRNVLDHDAALLEATWTGNFLHQFLLTQALVPAMLEAGGGLVVDVASSSATHDPPGPPGAGGWGLAYAASKAAFGRIAGALNAEYAGRGLQAYNVDPGFVVTESGAARGGNDALNDAGFPSADPGAVGAVVVWLLGAGEEDRQKFLGRTIWAPALLDRLRETPA
jgi:NAD(P)-dependent dehydrogenase (short-subunit alcohol dehydrogenase family)